MSLVRLHPSSSLRSIDTANTAVTFCTQVGGRPSLARSLHVYLISVMIYVMVYGQHAAARWNAMRRQRDLWTTPFLYVGVYDVSAPPRRVFTQSRSPAHAMHSPYLGDRTRAMWVYLTAVRRDSLFVYNWMSFLLISWCRVQTRRTSSPANSVRLGNDLSSLNNHSTTLICSSRRCSLPLWCHRNASVT